MRKIDITGKDYGFLHVNFYDVEESRKRRKSIWNCTCVCGNTAYCESYSLRNGNTVSCGCRRTDRPHTTHGKTHDPVYRIWQGMKERCFNENSARYPYYGGRGITVCSEWKNDFSAFYKWAMENGYEHGLSLDRIDNNGNYCPNNCRWASRSTQARNKRVTIMVTVNGDTKSLSDWSDITGVNVDALRERYRKGVKKGVSNFNNDFLLPSNSWRSKDAYPD